MAVILEKIIQGSEEWHQARLGSPGASSASKIITNSGQKSKQAEEYMYQLAGEYIAGKHEEGFVSQHMINGIEREAAARTLFELVTGLDVQQVGIVYKDEKKRFHCSPDGLVGDNSGLEIKNPMVKTQIKYLLKGTLPSEYFSQTQMSLYVSERDTWHFMSAYDGLPPLIIEVHRDEAFIKKLAQALDDFCEELASVVEKLRITQDSRASHDNTTGRTCFMEGVK